MKEGKDGWEMKIYSRREKKEAHKVVCILKFFTKNLKTNVIFFGSFNV